MSSDPLHDVGADMEMTTKEAAAYLSGPVGYTISPKVMYGLKSFGLGPIVEKRGSRLVYRRSALDAFLLENGTNAMTWHLAAWRTVADQLRAINETEPDSFKDSFIENIDQRGKDEWDPDQAK